MRHVLIFETWIWFVRCFSTKTNTMIYKQDNFESIFCLFFQPKNHFFFSSGYWRSGFYNFNHDYLNSLEKINGIKINLNQYLNTKNIELTNSSFYDENRLWLLGWSFNGMAQSHHVESRSKTDWGWIAVAMCIAELN